MKKLIKLVTAFIALLMVVPQLAHTSIVSAQEAFKVILLIPGNLGDRSFFDAAAKGIELVEAELDNVETRIVEMGVDETSWEPNMLDAAEADWDLIISGNSASALMNDIASQFPDKHFMNFDNAGDGAVENVYSVSYATNEGSFLAGILAGHVTKSDMELANEENVIGFLGGMDIPGINDFLVAYIQGAQYANEDVKVQVSYVGNFTDPAQGKELSNIMYQNGVDIAFNVAGQSGLGLIDAAHEANRYAIGVDSDQAKLFEETDTDKAGKILTSVVKNIDTTILEAVKAAQAGTLEYGLHELVGLERQAVGLAENEYYQAVSEDIRAQIEEAKEAIINGEIEIKSGFQMTTEEINDYRNTVAP